MVHVAERAAEQLASQGISAEVVYLRTLSPLDLDTVIASVRRTSRAVVVDGGGRPFGITGEIAAANGEFAFDHVDAPVMRFGARAVPVPLASDLEKHILPTPNAIAEAVVASMGGV